MSADIFEKIQANRGPIGQHAKESHGYFTFPKLEGPIGPHMIFRGKTRLNWSLNNYLGLANHPEVRQADAEAAADSRTRSWIRRRFSLEVSLPGSASCSAGEAACLASGPLDHRRVGGVGGAFTGTGFGSFSCGAGGA